MLSDNYLTYNNYYGCCYIRRSSYFGSVLFIFMYVTIRVCIHIVVNELERMCVWTFLIVVMSGLPNSLWAHPPLPPGKRILDRSISEDRKSTTFGFMRKFPSVRRGGVKKDTAMDTTYESFDSLFEDNDIVLAGGTAEYVDDSVCRNKRPPFTSMFRSRSDGNLAGSSSSVRGSYHHEPAEPKGFTKYLRALGGSWKNLLNSKLFMTMTLTMTLMIIYSKRIIRHECGHNIGGAHRLFSELGRNVYIKLVYIIKRAYTY